MYLPVIILLTICNVLFVTNTAIGETVFRVASYNVENLFDLKKNGNEYKEYVPNSRYQWNRITSEKKYNNIADVIKNLNSDIVAMQEVESVESLALLTLSLKKKGIEYPFSAISDSGGSVVNCAILSKFRICEKKEIRVMGSWRNILRLTIDIGENKFFIYNNHWLSKKYPESRRINAAKALMSDVETLGSGTEFIIVGDLNSDYDAYKRLASDSINKGRPVTSGINHILKTVVQSSYVKINKLVSGQYSDCMYNLWLEKSVDKRWSYIYAGRKSSLDHILIPASLCDGSGIDYEANSFNVYKSKSLFKNGLIFRWQKTDNGSHKGEGVSDHLPLYADFRVVN